MSTSGSNKPRIGLVLSGGGGRGYFHLGVARAMQELEIQPDIVCGTSAGSIAGVLLASNLNIQEIESEFPKSPLYNWHNFSFGFKGIAELNTLRKFLLKFVPFERLEELPTRFIPVATNLHTGKTVTPVEGPLVDWVMASCAIPIIVEPVKIDNAYYVDGGLLLNLPASVIRDHCDFLIGVNLFPHVEWMQSKKLSIRDVGHRSLELYLHQNSMGESEICDILITNKEIGNFSPQDYSNRKELSDLGYNTAKPIFQKMLNEKDWSFDA